MENTKPLEGNGTPTTCAPRLAVSDFREVIARRYPHWADEPSASDEEQAKQHAQAERHQQMRERQDAVHAFLRTVGTRYQDCRLENFEATLPAQKAAVARLSDYRDSLPDQVLAGNGIVLYGGAGSGKDHCLIGLARKAIAKYGMSIGWTNGADLFARFRDSMDADTTEARIVKQYTTPRILILSDPVPARGQLTDFQSATLLRIVDARYRACRPTWCSMNVSSSREADDTIGAALTDRLRHGALCLHFDWPSYRRAML